MLQPVKNATGVGAFQVLSFPLRIPLKPLPPQRPPAVLHADIVETSEQFVSSQAVDIDDPFAHKHDVLDFVLVERNDTVLVLEEDQGLVNCCQSIIVLLGIQGQFFNSGGLLSS